MKSIQLLMSFSLLLLIFSACQNEEVNDPGNLTQDINLAATDLDLGLDLSQAVMTIDLSDLSSTNQIQLISDYALEFFDEIGDILDGPEPVSAIAFSIKVEKELATLYNFEKVGKPLVAQNSQGGLESDGYARCPEGWSHVATCVSRTCVADALEEALAGIQSAGDCQELRVERAIFNAKICSRDCQD